MPEIPFTCTSSTHISSQSNESASQRDTGQGKLMEEEKIDREVWKEKMNSLGVRQWTKEDYDLRVKVAEKDKLRAEVETISSSPAQINIYEASVKDTDESSFESQTEEVDREALEYDLVGRIVSIQLDRLLSILGVSLKFFDRRRDQVLHHPNTNAQSACSLYSKCFKNKRRPRASLDSEESDEEVFLTKDVEVYNYENTWLSDASLMAQLEGDVATSRFIIKPEVKIKRKGFPELNRQTDGYLTGIDSIEDQKEPVKMLLEFNTQNSTSKHNLDRKALQLVSNLQSFQTLQPWRRFQLGIYFSDNQVLVFILNQECLFRYCITDPWKPQAFATLAALLQSIKVASIEHLGFLPLFKYNDLLQPISIHPERLPRLCDNVGKFSGKCYHSRSFPLLLEPICRPVLSFFQGGTLVLGQDLQKSLEFGSCVPPGYNVVTLRNIQESGAHRSTFVHEQLNAAVSNHSYDQSHSHFTSDDLHPTFTTLTKSFVFMPLPSQLSSSETKTLNKNGGRVMGRLLELTITTTFSRAYRIDQYPEVLSYREILVVCRSILLSVEEIYRLNILHRDISFNNILVTKGKDGFIRGILIDYDRAVSTIQGVDDSIRKMRTGTCLTMAHDVLVRADGFVHLPRHDLESLDIWLFLFLLDTFVKAEVVLRNLHQDWNHNAWLELCRELGLQKNITKTEAASARVYLATTRSFYQAMIKLKDLPVGIIGGLRAFNIKLHKIRLSALRQFEEDLEVMLEEETAEQDEEATRKLIDFNSEGKYLETSKSYLSALDDEIARLDNSSSEEVSFFDQCMKARRPKLEVPTVAKPNSRSSKTRSQFESL